MRNLPDYAKGFAELARTVRPGGRVVCLEIARPESRPARVLQFWFDRIVPLVGRVAGQGGAYGYLVRSVKGYPGPDRIAEIMREVGLATSPGRACPAASSRSTSARSRTAKIGPDPDPGTVG
jgi:demethylmenaquinone methyltransferase/2-methoxy-6-polyprenyl-1,4-benzoquinol methylase